MNSGSQSARPTAVLELADAYTCLLRQPASRLWGHSDEGIHRLLEPESITTSNTCASVPGLGVPTSTLPTCDVSVRGEGQREGGRGH